MPQSPPPIRFDFRKSVSHIRRRFRGYIAIRRVSLAVQWRHLRRAWRYANYTLSADEAQVMILTCRHAAGWYPLVTLTVENTLEVAREVFVDHPELSRLIADACAHVDQRWMSTGDDLHSAVWWAIEVAEEQATREGNDLLRREHQSDVVDDDGGEEL